MTRPSSQRGEAIYRVEITDRVNGRRLLSWANLTGPRLKCGFPMWQRAITRSPLGLMSGKDARAIVAAMRRKPWRMEARVVKDEAAAGQLQLRNPTGEAA
jgi:hypothetical protein